MKIVFASHTCMQGPFVVGSHHLAQNFARMGHQVLHVSAPVTPWHLSRPWRKDIQQRLRTWLKGGAYVEDRCFQVVPMSLYPNGYFFGVSMAVATTVPPLRRTIARLGFEKPDVLLIDDPRFAGLAEQIRSLRTIYRVTDLYQQMQSKSRTAKLEQAVLRSADRTICTSEPVAEHMRELTGRQMPISVIENGVDFPLFATPANRIPPEYTAITGPRAVYVGAFDFRFDWEVICKAAEARPNVQFVLIGPVALDANRRVRGLSNVHLLGPRKYAELPAYMQNADVGLLPFSDHPSNEGRSPMKLYEYTAAGLQVVARRTGELARRRLPSMAFYENATGFCAALDAALAGPMPRSEIAAGAAAYGWPERARAVLDFVLEREASFPARSSTATAHSGDDPDQVASSVSGLLAEGSA